MSKGSNSREFLRFKNSLRASPREAHRVLSDARATLSAGLFPEVIGWVRKNPLYSTKVFHPEYPATIPLLKRAPPLGSVSLDRELRWASAYLSFHIAQIRTFIDIAANFHRSFLSDNLDQCRRDLERVEEEFGQSLWLIKCRIALLQQVSGLEAQKEYAQQIQRIRPNSIPAFVAYYASVRNEPTVTPQRHAADFDKHLSTLTLPAPFSDYLRYAVSPSVTLSDDSAVGVLHYEGAGPVVDYYEAIVYVANRLVARATEVTRPALRHVIRELHVGIGDNRLRTASALLHVQASQSVPCPPCPVDASNALLEGNLAALVSSADQLLNSSPDDPDAFVLAATGRALLGEMNPEQPALYGRLVRRAANVLAHGYSNDDANDLKRFAMNSYGSPLAMALLAVIEDEASDTPETSHATFANLSAVYNPTMHPLRTLGMPLGPDQVAYATMSATLHGTQLSTVFALALCSEELPQAAGMSAESHALLRAYRGMAAGDFQDVLV
jgi:hypothetical protein